MAKRSRARQTRPASREPGGPCPCGSEQEYPLCCGQFHRGEATAPTAQALMRSRYSAFAIGNEPYLLRTWHPDTRPARLRLDDRQHWTGLRVLATSAGGMFDSTGTVEFLARYEYQGAAGSLHERSRFIREGGQWYYVAGLDPRG